MSIKNHRTPQACIHLYNPPVPPAGYPHDPNAQNEPNLPQSQISDLRFFPGRTPNMQNEPNFTRSGPMENKKMRNEPNFSRGGPVEGKKCETNPKRNAGRRPATSIFNPGLSAGVPRPHPKHAKRTQSRIAGTPYFNETNPISGAADLWKTKKMRNEPNLRRTPNIQSTIYNPMAPRQPIRLTRS